MIAWAEIVSYLEAAVAPNRQRHLEAWHRARALKPKLVAAMPAELRPPFTEIYVKKDCQGIYFQTWTAADFTLTYERPPTKFEDFRVKRHDWFRYV